MTVRIWVYDGIPASGVLGPTDVSAAANDLAARDGSVATADRDPIRWQVESADGGPVLTASGQIIEVDGRMDAFLAHRAVIDTVSRAARRLHERDARIASYCTAPGLSAAFARGDRREAPGSRDAQPRRRGRARVGYSDPGAFRQIFKREAGLSPRIYRSRFQHGTSADLVEALVRSRMDEAG